MPSHSSYPMRQRKESSIFWFCSWLQVILAVGIAGGLFIIRAFRPEWSAAVMQMLSEVSFQLSDLFSLFPKAG